MKNSKSHNQSYSYTQCWLPTRRSSLLYPLLLLQCAIVVFERAVLGYQSRFKAFRIACMEGFTPMSTRSIRIHAMNAHWTVSLVVYGTEDRIAALRKFGAIEHKERSYDLGNNLLPRVMPGRISDLKIDTWIPIFVADHGSCYEARKRTRKQQQFLLVSRSPTACMART